MIVGGSVARGYADRWSDVEIGVFWSALPSERARADLAALAGLLEWNPYPDPSPTGAVEEDGMRGDVKVDLVHLDLRSVEQSITAVIDHSDPSLDRQALVAALLDGLPLAGESLLLSWKARVAVYPEALRITMVRSHLGFGPHAWLDMLAEREDVLVLHGLLCQIGQTIITIVLGINGIYIRSPGLRWMHQTIAQCTIAPRDLAHRLHALLRADPHTAVIDAGLLINETLALIDHHLPVVDTAPVRQRIAALPRGLTGSSTT